VCCCVLLRACARETAKERGTYAAMQKYYHSNFSGNKKTRDEQTKERGRSAVETLDTLYMFALTHTKFWESWVWSVCETAPGGGWPKCEKLIWCPAVPQIHTETSDGLNSLIVLPSITTLLARRILLSALVGWSLRTA
jgi:hypothetical protein